MSIVAGKDVIFYLFDGMTWRPYLCARSQDDSVNTDSIETTGPGDGNWKTFEPTAHSWNRNIDGIVSINDPAGLTLPELRTLQFAKTVLLCREVSTSQAGNTYTEEGYVFITSSTKTGSFDGVATFRVGFQGTGPITQIYTPPTPPAGNDMRYPAMGAVAPPTTLSYTWTALGVGSKYILNVVKDGRGSSNIILSGTPVGNEVKYTTVGSDGVFEWAFPFEDGETPPYVEYRDT